MIHDSAKICFALPRSNSKFVVLQGSSSYPQKSMVHNSIVGENFHFFQDLPRFVKANHVDFFPQAKYDHLPGNSAKT